MNESDKNLENLIEKMMAENTLESPSIDFTSKIMSQITAAEEVKAKVYKPLISTQIWVFIAVSLLALVIYSFISGNEYDLKVNEIYADKFSGLFSEFHFSKKALYAILIVPFMVLIQITVLKNYHEKRHQF